MQLGFEKTFTWHFRPVSLPRKWKSIFTYTQYTKKTCSMKRYWMWTPESQKFKRDQKVQVKHVNSAPLILNSHAYILWLIILNNKQSQEKPFNFLLRCRSYARPTTCCIISKFKFKLSENNKLDFQFFLHVVVFFQLIQIYRPQDADTNVTNGILPHLMAKHVT